MMFWLEQKDKKILVYALLNCGRWYVTFWLNKERIKPNKKLLKEAIDYIRLFSDKPIEL